MVKLYLQITKFLKELKRDHASAYAAQASYFIVLSFIPFTMLLMTLVKFTPITKSNLLEFAVDLLPSTIDPLVIGVIDEVYKKTVAVVSVTAILAIWSSAKGFLAIINALNTVYDVKETRNYYILRIRAAIYTLLFIIAIILSFSILVFGNSIHSFLQDNYPFIANISGFIIRIRLVFILLVLILFFSIIYHFVPNRKSSFKCQIPGAVVSAVSWYAFSYGFSLYVDHFTGFSNMYGSLTTLIIVMLWLYGCMYLMLIGAEINSYYEVLFKKYLQ